jgi:hypothetical protein
MKITVIKKAEAKKTADAQCPWVVEDMLSKRK